MQAQLKVMNKSGHTLVEEDVSTIEGLERAYAAVPEGSMVFSADSLERVRNYDPREQDDVIVVPAFQGG